MSRTDKETLDQFIHMRQDTAFQRLKKNKAYMTVFEKQSQSETEIDELLKKLETGDGEIFTRHREGDTELHGMELNAAYVQGLRDSVKIMILMGVFDVEVAF
jgi:hypothetical protein